MRYAKERALPRCQYGVYSPSAFDNGYCADCGEPAIEYLWWGDESHGLFVCEEHCEKVCDDEENNDED